MTFRNDAAVINSANDIKSERDGASNAPKAHSHSKFIRRRGLKHAQRIKKIKKIGRKVTVWSFPVSNRNL